MDKQRGITSLFFLFSILLITVSSAYAVVDRVLCVPWEGDPAKYHTAISGVQVDLNAVIYGDALGGSVAYSWNFSDGTAPVTGTISVPANGIYNLKVTHTFTAALGATFPTVLTVGGISDVYNVIIASNNNDAKVNIAIDKGLWYLHTQMIRTNVGSPSVPGGYWNDNNYYVGRTGASVWAFEVQGHLLPVEANPLIPVEDPYVEDVQRGINYLLTRTYPQGINKQTYGWPEDYDGDNLNNDGNGIGLVCYYRSGLTNYENGLAMGALAGCGSPLATAATGNATYVLGRTYRDIVQDMADWYAWSQIDSINFPRSGARGGWYYYAANNANWGANAGDNSACQWAYIGLEAAQANFGCTIPAWMKTQLAGYLHNQLAYGSRGWVSYRANENTNNVCLTGGALVGMALVGETIYDAQNGAGAYAADLSLVKTFMGNKWHGTWDRWEENWYGHRAYYTMYAVMKGFRLQGITSLLGPPGTPDWYDDYVGVMIPDQHADGHWRGTGWMDGYIHEDMGTAFGVLILTPSIFSPSPVACFTAEPNPGYLDTPIKFDPGCSYHSDAGKNIVLYEWDLDNDGVFDRSTPTPDIQTHVWDSAAFGLGIYPVKLRVTDDTSPTPVTDTYTLDVVLSLPPHPPVADADGPYMVSLCPGDSLTLDGSGSYDIDEGLSEPGADPDTIISYEWDLDGAPWSYPSAPGATGMNLVVDDLSGFSAGEIQIALKVSDNTANSYPGSGEPNLTDEDFTQVKVYEGCVCDLAARVKRGKVQLTWTHTGAASYDIYRSTEGPNSGFVQIADDHVTTYATYLDGDVINGTTYYYRVVTSDGCGSVFVMATPSATRSR